MALEPNGTGPIAAPVAVRVLDLDVPLSDLCLSDDYPQQDYRSLLAVVRLAEDPVGVATFPVEPGGCVTRAQLAGGVHRQLGTELHEAYARRYSVGTLDPFSDLAERADIPRLPSVSVVVRTCRNPGLLERCLRSILACEYDDFEVIVVENKPRSPESANMLLERFPVERRLRYVEESGPSASLARNAGLERAEGEVVAFTDDEVVVDPCWLRASVEALLSGRGVACVTGLTLPRNLNSETQVLLEPVAGVGKGLRRRTYRLPDSCEEHPLLSYTTGAVGSRASIVMLTQVGRELGGFDPALGPATPAHGGEDLDLLRRLLRKGYALSYEPKAIVWRENHAPADHLRHRIYRQGVGLGATLSKQLIAGPERRELVRAIPAGLRYLRRPGSPKNVDQPGNYPRHLRWLQRLGMLVGPIAYLVSALLVRARRLVVKRAPNPRPLRSVRRIVMSGEAIDVVWFRDVQAPRLRYAWRRSAERDPTGASDQVVPSSVLTLPPADSSQSDTLRISVVVPARNAEAWIESCLRAIRDNHPAEVILVDGGSADRTVELARPWVDKVIDDGGAGVAGARMLGAVSASQPWIALVDADVVLPPNALRELDRERSDRQLVAIQAGLHSVGAGDYWSQSLADHHNGGRSKGWFGVCASLIARDILMAHPLDVQLSSGEDIDLRIRLNRAGLPVGVSEATISQHRFGKGCTFARGQWLDDGAGLGRMVRKHGRAALINAMIPFGAAALGIFRGAGDGLRSWPYFSGLAVGNYVGLWRGLLDRRVRAGGRGRRLLVAMTLASLLALPGALALSIVALVFLMSRLAHAAYQGRLLLATLVIFAVAIPFEVGSGGESGRFPAIARQIAPFTAWAMLLGLILSGLRLAQVVGL